MLLLLVQYPAAPAFAFSFVNIAGGDTPGDAYVNSFTFDVLNKGSSVIFKIKNSGYTGPPSMFISKVLFDDNKLSVYSRG